MKNMNNMKNLNLGFPSLPGIPQIPVLKGNISLGGSSDFKSIFSDMLGKVNSMMSSSSELTEKAITTGKVDVHEVMIALEEEEIAFGLTTNIASKFISTIEKLTQMQV